MFLVNSQKQLDSGRRMGELQLFKARFFRALAHPIRIAILEELTHGSRRVSQLQDRLGVGQSLLSQHLALLRTNGIVTADKEGLSVRYALRDPLVGDLLKVARQIFSNQLSSHHGLLRELAREARRP